MPRSLRAFQSRTPITASTAAARNPSAVTTAWRVASAATFCLSSARRRRPAQPGTGLGLVNSTAVGAANRSAPPASAAATAELFLVLLAYLYVGCGEHLSTRPHSAILAGSSPNATPAAPNPGG